MKSTIILLAFIAVVYAAPTSIQDNNIGDIISVGINAQLKIDNKVDQNIVNVIVALLNQELGIVALEGDQKFPDINITPEMIERVKGLLVRP
jgi:hypothetical protein